MNTQNYESDTVNIVLSNILKLSLLAFLCPPRLELEYGLFSAWLNHQYAISDGDAVSSILMFSCAFLASLMLYMTAQFLKRKGVNVWQAAFQFTAIVITLGMCALKFSA